MAEPPPADRRLGNSRAAERAWWSRRFLAVIESIGLSDALRVGRRLVRTEAVLSLRRSGNLVVAMVRHPGEDVHKARLAVRSFGTADWMRVEAALATEASYAATLLAGSMPAEIERVFTTLGLALFPTGADDLAMDCSCDDWQRPCAHLAAACYLLAESFDLDPFAVLALRGRERDDLLGHVRDRRHRSAPPATATDRARYSWPSAGDWSHGDAASLPTSVAAFWSSSTRLDQPGVTAGHRLAARPDILLDLCGPLAAEPLGDLRDLLRPAYQVFAAGDGRSGS